MIPCWVREGKTLAEKENIMDSKDYVLNHDFGYGKGDLACIINKLELRNIEDIKFYVNWSIKEIFIRSMKKILLSVI